MVTMITKAREHSKKFATFNNEESMTQQSDAADCDINVIMKKYGATGMLPQVQMQAMQGDFSEADDFRSVQEKIKAANDAFAAVPAHIRKRFGNDPAEFIEFATNKDNLDELRKLGLAEPEKKPPPEPPPMKVIVTNPEQPK